MGRLLPEMREVMLRSQSKEERCLAAEGFKRGAVQLLTWAQGMFLICSSSQDQFGQSL